MKGLAGVGLAGVAGSSALAQGTKLPDQSALDRSGPPVAWPRRFVVRRGHLVTMDGLGDIPDGDVMEKRPDRRGGEKPQSAGPHRARRAQHDRHAGVRRHHWILDDNLRGSP